MMEGNGKDGMIYIEFQWISQTEILTHFFYIGFIDITMFKCFNKSIYLILISDAWFKYEEMRNLNWTIYFANHHAFMLMNWDNCIAKNKNIYAIFLIYSLIINIYIMSLTNSNFLSILNKFHRKEAYKCFK